MAFESDHEAAEHLSAFRSELVAVKKIKELTGKPEFKRTVERFAGKDRMQAITIAVGDMDSKLERIDRYLSGNPLATDKALFAEAARAYKKGDRPNVMTALDKSLEAFAALDFKGLAYDLDQVDEDALQAESFPSRSSTADEVDALKKTMEEKRRRAGQPTELEEDELEREIIRQRQREKYMAEDLGGEAINDIARDRPGTSLHDYGQAVEALQTILLKLTDNEQKFADNVATTAGTLLQHHVAQSSKGNTGPKRV